MYCRGYQKVQTKRQKEQGGEHERDFQKCETGTGQQVGQLEKENEEEEEEYDDKQEEEEEEEEEEGEKI